MTDEPPQHATTTSDRRRLVVGLFAVLVPVVPIVIALFLTGGSGARATATRTRTAAYEPVAQSAPGSASEASNASKASKTTPEPRTGVAVPAGHGALVAYVSHPTALRSRPGGPKIAEIQRKTDFGSPTFVLVSTVKGRWLGVINTAAGNNRIGWIPARGVALSRDLWRLHAVLARHLLRVYHDGREVRHFPIATGKPTAPTPTGHFAVTDRLDTGDPEGPYGCCILATSATAPHHISDWDGGNRIAIHSTPETDSIGYSVSHGCMRLSLADGQWLIDHIPLGTPVGVSSG